MKLFNKIGLIVIMIISLQACKKLALQKSFDFDENDHPVVQPPFNMTIWDFITIHDEFSLMEEAVKLAAMEETYSSGDSNKTVLLLRNEAMQEFLTKYNFATVSDVPVTRLQSFLKYHVITTRFTQIDLPVQQFVVFQTLIPGDNGRINIWKWREYWEIRINTGGPDLPATAKSANVYLHNYEFTNGVGHQMKQFVQWVPY